MDTRETLLAAALKVLEEKGQAQFSTRAVCAIAKVKAPTLYHHFGSIDGLLSAAIAAAFEQFLASKKAAVQSPDPVMALCEGWDDYVRFAAERPRLYAAMMARVLQGADIPAAKQAHALLVARITAIAAEGRLAMPVEAATHVAWASANSAALLYVTAALQVVTEPRAPEPDVVARLRDDAIQSICTPLPTEHRP
ncbi:TetR/AcrR family transcriptional regulator [Burkholderia stagnalis]